MADFEKTINFCESSHKLNPEMREPAELLASTYAFLDRDDDARRIVSWVQRYWTWTPDFKAHMRDFPFKNPKIVNRFVEGFEKSDLSISVSSGYYKILDKNRLTGQQIKALVFGRKIIGLEGWFARSHDGSANYRGYLAGSDQGQSWIENDLLCDQWQERYGGHKIFYPVFRNPEGNPKNQDEYLYITDTIIFSFSTLD